MEQKDLKAASPLEALLTEALANRTPPKQRKSTGERILLGELTAAARRVREYFRNPENWYMSRHVTLIHEDSNTLLGNFEEYRHKGQKDCRKLIRCEKPSAVEQIEYVKGANWHDQPLTPGADETAPEVEEREIIVDLHMPELDNVFSPQVMVTARLEYGGIARLELCEETRFFSKDKKVQLILPYGLDVLEGLSLDCKLEVRKALGL